MVANLPNSGLAVPKINNTLLYKEQNILTFFLHYKYHYGIVYYFVLSLNYAKKKKYKENLI